MSIFPKNYVDYKQSAQDLLQFCLLQPPKPSASNEVSYIQLQKIFE